MGGGTSAPAPAPEPAPAPAPAPTAAPAPGLVARSSRSRSLACTIASSRAIRACSLWRFPMCAPSVVALPGLSRSALGASSASAPTSSLPSGAHEGPLLGPSQDDRTGQGRRIGAARLLGLGVRMVLRANSSGATRARGRAGGGNERTKRAECVTEVIPGLRSGRELPRCANWPTRRVGGLLVSAISCA